MTTKIPLQLIYDAAARRPDGYVNDVLSFATIDGDTAVFLTVDYEMLAKKYSPEKHAKRREQRKSARPPRPPQPATPKPGSELKLLLSKVGILANPDCSCNNHSRAMDDMEAKEPGWCEKNMETICDWLQEEATKRKLPFVRVVARLLVKRAIANAKRKSALTD